MFFSCKQSDNQLLDMWRRKYPVSKELWSTDPHLRFHCWENWKASPSGTRDWSTANVTQKQATENKLS
jgi:hypothetical protein